MARAVDCGMDIVRAVASGRVKIDVQLYADGRYGFDFADEVGKRVKCRFTSEAKATEKAKEKAKLISNGRVDMMAASRQEWATFEVWKAAGLSMEELAEFRAWRASRIKTKTVDEIRNELLALKEEDSDLDAVYVTNLKGGWKLLCEAFGNRAIIDVSASELEAWLRDLKRTPRTRNNYRDASVQLFRFAREREYLPDSITVAEKVKRLKIKARADDIEIWSLAEMRMLLKHVREEYLPWMVIGAFAGVRTEEICPNITSHKDPLRWEDIQWDEKQIMVRAETSKVGRTRFVPMQCNLLAWLQSYRDRKGPVLTCPVNTLYNELKLMRTRIRKAAKNAKNEEFEKFTFKKNALRHSFGSYRNAIIRSIGQLSDEMGNSPAIAKCNYERPQPRAVADEWFSIMPENKSK